MSRKLGILIAGLDGAVATTVVAGTALIRRGLTRPIAMLSESEPLARKCQLAPLEDVVFGGWDTRGENLFEAALRNEVLDKQRLTPIAKELAATKPWTSGSAIKIRRDIETFRRKHKLASVVVVNLLPTGLDREAQLYARAAIESGCPFLNFTPNQAVEVSPLVELADRHRVPTAGKDGKTGQTWIKSVLAPAFAARGLRVTGWYSTNLLGNEDGKVVGDPEKGASKIASKQHLLGEMLGYEPHHTVQINFYPPRGDNKESWDNIDFEGFLGLPMQLKIDGLWRDSVLAAPMIIDLVRFLDLAHRRGDHGPQEWLSFYFKSPMTRAGKAVHAASEQYGMLRDYLEGWKKG